jgi:uncharacterized cupredoxin-like copper-binding protein
MRVSRAALACALAASTVAFAACGSSSTSTPAGAAVGGGEVLNVSEGVNGEFTIDPSQQTITAGKVSFDVKNGGKSLHELLVIPLSTGSSADSLRSTDGSADESTKVGEVAEIAPGATKDGLFDLKPGTYALICNQPGHFAAGMHTIITVS